MAANFETQLITQVNTKDAITESDTVFVKIGSDIVQIPFSVLKDAVLNIGAYIENRGQSGIWRYHKYSDGTFECFTLSPYRYEENAECNVPWGELYNSGYFTPPELPFKSLTAIHYVYTYVTGDPGTSGEAYISYDHNGSMEKLPQFCFVRPTIYTIGHPQVHFWVRGTFR